MSHIDGTLWKPWTLQVTFLDVGHGDGIFIRTPHSWMDIDKTRYSMIDWGEEMVDYLKAQNIRKN
ncbi:MAG: hypothetical protein AB1765_07690 [Candidatus Hydrogenedentota bacterium]